MHLCNETITVFNAKLDETDGYDIYTGTVINSASWHCDIKSTVDNSGLKAGYLFTIRIPTDADFSGKAYADPLTYAGGDPDNLFTLQNGDVIVKGEVTETGLKPADLHKNYEAFTVLSVTDNRRAKAPHWKVVGA